MNFKYNLTGLIPFTKYGFEYKASNVYGDSDFSYLQYLTPGDFPEVIGVPKVVTYEDWDYVFIQWKETFSKYSLPDIHDFEVHFLSSSNNWHQIPLYCSSGDYNSLYS